jgi:hypothetical protein
MPLIERASRLVLPAQGAGTGLHLTRYFLSTEHLEDSASSTAELLRVHDLMEHDRTSRHPNIADLCALLVLLVSDDNTARVDTLSGVDSP